MADIKTPEERSRNMSAIRGKNTKPESFLRKLLFSRGYRYRMHSALIPGHPDIWLRKHNTAVFIHGCFWHRHQGCRYAYTPKSRAEFWLSKFERNIIRDQEVKQQLQSQHIKCLVVWECTIKAMKKEEAREKYLCDIEEFLRSDNLYAEL